MKKEQELFMLSESKIINLSNPWKPMTDKETLERIEKDAHDFTEGWGENCDIKSFIAGAKSERNKTIEEAIEIISSYRSLDRTQLKEILESLKL